MIDRLPTRLFSGRIVLHSFDPAKPGIVTFKVESRPFEGDPPYASDFYATIGRFVVLWGRFEHHVEMILHTLIAVAATYGIQENMQIPFSRKATIFRRIYRDCAGLSNRAGT